MSTSAPHSLRILENPLELALRAEDLESANSDPPFSLAMKSSSSRRSDDFPFSSRRIPALHFTTGDHKDYHLTTDTVDRVNMAGLVRVIDYVERVARLVDR
jgi:hypothetical protein